MDYTRAFSRSRVVYETRLPRRCGRFDLYRDFSGAGWGDVTQVAPYSSACGPYRGFSAVARARSDLSRDERGIGRQEVFKRNIPGVVAGSRVCHGNGIGKRVPHSNRVGAVGLGD
jgi:hypothetical protein